MIEIIKRFDVRISLIYALVAGVWIIASDTLAFVLFANNADTATVVGIMKGIGFVLLTTALLYGMLSRERRKRERAEAALQIERDISPIATLVFDPLGHITYANGHAERLLGVPRSQLIGQLFNAPHWHVTDYDGHPISDDAQIARALAAKQTVYGIQHAVEVTPGQRLLLEINLAPLYNERDELVSCVATFVDVTVTKQHDKLLRASEASFRLLFQSNPHPMWVYDRKTLEFIEVNDAAVQRYGYSREEFLARRITDIRPLQEVRKLLAHLEDNPRLLRHAGEWIHQTKNGDLIDVEITSHELAYNGRQATLVVAQDVSKRKQTEKELRDSEASLKRAQAIAHVGDWTWDTTTNMLRWSDEMYRIFGIDRDSFNGDLNAVIDTAIHPDDRAAVNAANAEVTEQQKPGILEYRVVWPDGSVRYVRAQAGESVTDADGKILRLSGVVQDITERKQVERALVEREASLKRAQAVAHVGSWTWDLQTNRVRWTDEMYRIFGIDPSQFSANVADIIQTSVHPDDREAVNRFDEAIIRGERPERLEYRVIWPDGTVRFVWGEAGERVLDGHGQVIQLSGIVQDITAQKQAELALRESEVSLKRAQAIAQLGDWTWDLLTNHVHWSDEMYRIHGLDKSANTVDLNAVLQAAVHPDDRDLLRQANESVLHERKGGTWEYRVVWPDGSIRHIRAVTTPAVVDSSGSVTQLSGIVQDITKRKQAELALLESEASLRRAQAIAHMGNWTWNTETDVVRCSDEIYHIFGCERGDFDDNPMQMIVAFIHPDDRAFGQQINAAIHRGESDNGWTFRIVRRDGVLRYLRTEVGEVQRDAAGHLRRMAGIIQDITDYVQAEKDLLESEASLKQAQAIGHMGDWTFDLQTQQIRASDEVYRIFDVDREAFSGSLGDVLVNNIHPDDQRRLIRLLERAASENRIEAGQMEFRLMRPDQSVRYIMVEVGEITTDAAGNISHVTGIIQEITERKLAEEELRLKSTALESAANGVVITDVDGNIQWANPAFCALTGYTREEAYGQNPRALVRSGEHPTSFYAHMWKTILSGKVWRGELVNRRKDGTLYTEDQTITPVRNEAGEITHFVGIKTDITERKETEAAIRKLNEELEARVEERTIQLNHIKNRIESILNSNADPIIFSRVDGKIEQVNPAFTQIFGYGSDEILLQPFTSLVEAKDLGAFEKSFAGVTAHLQSGQVDIATHTRDGRVFDTAVMLSPVIEHDNRLMGVVLSVHNITDRNQMLRHAMNLSELKSRYVSMAAHDLRNPMAVILTSSDTLEHYHDRLSEDKRKAKYEQIRSSIKVMTDILDDVLIMGQVDSGKLEFHPAALDVVAFCERLIADIVQATATTTQIEFTPNGITHPVMMDAKLLRHILGNLLSNAIKYSPENSRVSFGLGCEDDTISFHIRDRGIGIPKKDQAHLFETFYRASNAKNIRGTGLGLAIVKQSVDLHGGTIHFESDEGKGTVFVVTLPVMPPSV